MDFPLIPEDFYSMDYSSFDFDDRYSTMNPFEEGRNDITKEPQSLTKEPQAPQDPHGSTAQWFKPEGSRDPPWSRDPLAYNGPTTRSRKKFK